jgi:hypothetical protein
MGQPFASPFTPESSGEAMHKPSEQTRPLLQSACVSHVKSPLRWLIEQLLAATTATPRAASKTWASFTATLRS